MSFFDHLEEIPPDPIFGLTKAYVEDKNPKKTDLTVGIYYNDELKPEVMKTVKKAELALCDLEKTKTYLPIDGDQFYLEATRKLLFGEEIAEKQACQIYSTQTVGGTGALRVVADTLKTHLTDTICISDPTWPNHLKVFKTAGLKLERYSYYNKETKLFDFEKSLEVLETLKPKTAVLLHGCCHNPTGRDPTKQQWEQLSKLILKKKLIPVFDIAYQGFGESLEEDAWAIRHFVKSHHEMFVCYSYSKIFGLYAERTGAVFAVSENAALKKIIGTNIKPIIRANYSNPPKHGSSIVSYILHHEELKKEWRKELDQMRARIKRIKYEFCKALCEKSKKIDYSYIQYLNGLFCLIGFSKTDVQRIIDEFGIYMTYGGRINLTGINDDNIEYIVDAILKISHSA